MGLLLLLLLLLLLVAVVVVAVVVVVVGGGVCVSGLCTAQSCVHVLFLYFFFFGVCFCFCFCFWLSLSIACAYNTTRCCVGETNEQQALATAKRRHGCTRVHTRVHTDTHRHTHTHRHRYTRQSPDRVDNVVECSDGAGQAGNGIHDERVERGERRPLLGEQERSPGLGWILAGGERRRCCDGVAMVEVGLRWFR